MTTGHPVGTREPGRDRPVPGGSQPRATAGADDQQCGVAIVTQGGQVLNRITEQDLRLDPDRGQARHHVIEKAVGPQLPPALEFAQARVAVRAPQAGAAYGYTQLLGYHPLLATRADTREALHIRLRKGSANTQKGIVRFTN